MSRARAVAALAAVLALVGPECPGAEIPSHPSLLSFAPSRFRPPDSSEHRIVLAPGVVGFAQRDPLLPLVELTLAFDFGSEDDPPDRVGLAVLAGAALARGGSATLPPAEFHSTLESLGADLVSLVRGRRALVRLSTPSWTASEAIRVVFDLVTEPRFDESIFEVTHRTALEGLARRSDDPLDVLEREWTWLTFGPDHPAGRAPTRASLGAISRSDLIAFYRCHWRPDNMVAALSGDITESLLEEIERRVASWTIAASSTSCPTTASKAGGARPRSGEALTAPTAPGVRVALHQTPQAKIIIGHRLPESPGWADKERFALLVAVEILGGSGAISRLGGRLRTAEGLVYRASADLDLDVPGREEFRIILETRPDRVWRAVDEAVQEVETLRETLVHPRELEVVRETLVGALRSEFDTAEEVVGYLAEDVLLGRPPDYWRRYLDGIRSVSREDIQKAARNYLHPALMTTLIVAPGPPLGVDGGVGTSRTPGGEPIEILPVRDPSTLETIGPTR